MNQERIGNFIKDLREKNNLTQEELAEKLYIRRQSVSKWEVGKTCPDSENFKMLSEIFNVSIDELISGEYITKKDAIAKSEELKIKILDESNAVKSKNRVLGKIIVILLVILILSFVFYYFFTTYNQFKIYYISGLSDEISISDGYIFETNEKVFFQLGNINIDEAEILATTVYYLDNKDEVVIYRSDNYDNNYIQDSKNHPEYFYTKVNYLIDNIYVKLKTKEKEYNIKLDYRLDYINNKLFFDSKKNEIPNKKDTSITSSEFQKLYDFLSKNDFKDFSFEDKVYQYEISFIKQLNKVDVMLINKDDISYCTYSYSFEKDELYKNLLDESYDKCEKNDSCYTQWEKIVNNIIDNLKKE